MPAHKMTRAEYFARRAELEAREAEYMAKADAAYHADDVVEYGNAAADARDAIEALDRLDPGPRPKRAAR